MELLDVYDDNGNVTGKLVVRGEKNLKDGEHIAVAVIFIKNSNELFLMQKTSKLKGGEYSSTGGHVNSGETPLETIKREVLEEIGIDVSKDEIKSLGYIIYDMPIRYIFYLEKDINIDDIKVQESEVEYVKYMSVEEIEELINNNEITKSHGILFKEMLKKCKE